MPDIIQFQYLYQVSPIILVGGVAAQVPGSQVSIYSYLQGGTGFPITGPAFSNDLDEAPQFLPLQGGELISQDIGRYPFFNQQTAANAVITRELHLSYRMIYPARGPDGFSQRQAIITALAATLRQHNLSGGLYTCITPAYVWTNCVMNAVRDITPESDSTQRQIMWQFDFEAPLVASQAATASYNTFMQKLQSMTQVTPSGSGAIATSGPQAASTSSAPAVTPPARGGVSTPSVAPTTSGLAVSPDLAGASGSLGLPAVPTGNV